MAENTLFGSFTVYSEPRIRWNRHPQLRHQFLHLTAPLDDTSLIQATLATLALWGFAAILYVAASPSPEIRKEILLITGVVFLLSGMLSAGFTKGKHISWLFFWIISGISFYAATNSSNY